MRSLHYFAIYLALFGPRLEAIDLSYMGTLYGLVSAAFFSRRLSRLFWETVIGFLLLLLVALVHFIITGMADPFGLFLCIKLTVFFVSAVGLAAAIRERDRFKTQQRIALLIAITAALDASTALFFKTSENWRSLIGEYFYVAESSLHWLDGQYRAIDISLGGGASASMTFSMGYLIALALLVGGSKRAKLLLTALVVLFAATLITGRTGAYACVAITLLTIGRAFVIGKQWPRVLAALFFGALVLLLFASRYPSILEWIMRPLTPAASFNLDPSEPRFFSAYSAMWFIPQDLITFIFGNGNFGRNPALPYVPSDVGYIRAVWAWGISGSVAIYLATVWPLVNNHRSLQKYGRSSGTEQRLELKLFNLCNLILIILLLAFNLKELHLMARGSAMLLLFWASPSFLR